MHSMFNLSRGKHDVQHEMDICPCSESMNDVTNDAKIILRIFPIGGLNILPGLDSCLKSSDCYK